jgi:hypothetical protein
MLVNHRFAVCVVIEALEPHQLLALTSEYFPLLPGSTWDYAGTFAGQSSTEHSIAVADTLNGKPVVRLDTEVTTLPSGPLPENS